MYGVQVGGTSEEVACRRCPAGTWSSEPGADSEANNSKLLQELREVSEGRRDAAFVCSICCVGVPAEGDGPIDVLFTSEGRCGGRIAFEPYGEGGFGYDPLFLPDERPGLSMAQLPLDEKNAISHRGRAFIQLPELLAQRGL